MLKDELKTNIEPLPTHENPLRKTLETDIEAFLKAGGKIQPVGNEPVHRKGIFNPAIAMNDASSIHIVQQKRRTKVKAKSGHQNIKKHKTGWSAIVGSIDSGLLPTLEQAIKTRDSMREAMGLPPTDY